MKRNAIARIILYSILALTLTGIMLGGIFVNSFDFPIQLGSSGTEVDSEATFEASKIKNLEINWAAGSVRILAADTDHITISEDRPENSKYILTYRLSGDTLTLDYAKGNVTIGFGNHSIPSKDLIITVPRDWLCEELKIDGASLDIDLQDLNVGTIDLDGASCKMEFVGNVDKVEIDGASADITLNCGNRVSSIDVDGASCDLDVTLPKDCGFLVNMDGLGCDFHSELSGIAQNGSYSYGDQHCRIDVDGLSCDVTIRESLVWPIGE